VKNKTSEQQPLTPKHKRMTVPASVIAECIEAGKPQRRTWQDVAGLLLERGLEEFRRDGRLFEGGDVIQRSVVAPVPHLRLLQGRKEEVPLDN
jgi:hypothetical protein